MFLSNVAVSANHLGPASYSGTCFLKNAKDCCKTSGHIAGFPAWWSVEKIWSPSVLCCNDDTAIYLSIYKRIIYSTSSTAQGGGGSFKKTKPIGGWLLWITDGRAKPLMDRKVIDVSSLSLFLWLSTYLPTYLSHPILSHPILSYPILSYLSIHLSIYLILSYPILSYPIYLSYLSLSIYLSVYLAIYLSHLSI